MGWKTITRPPGPGHHHEVTTTWSPAPSHHHQVTITTSPPPGHHVTHLTVPPSHHLTHFTVPPGHHLTHLTAPPRHHLTHLTVQVTAVCQRIVPWQRCPCLRSVTGNSMRELLLICRLLVCYSSRLAKKQLRSNHRTKQQSVLIVYTGPYHT